MVMPPMIDPMPRSVTIHCAVLLSVADGNAGEAVVVLPLESVGVSAAGAHAVVSSAVSSSALRMVCMVLFVQGGVSIEPQRHPKSFNGN